MPGKAEEKSFGKPDEVRVFPKGKVELVTIGGATIGRATLEPGWRWSSSVQPIAKTKSCEAPHFQYHVAGTLKVVMDDGTETPYLASITMAVTCRNMRPKSTRFIEEFLKRSLEDHADLRPAVTNPTPLNSSTAPSAPSSIPPR